MRFPLTQVKREGLGEGNTSCFVPSSLVVARSSKSPEIFRRIIFFPISKEKKDEQDLELISTEKSQPCSS